MSSESFTHALNLRNSGQEEAAIEVFETLNRVAINDEEKCALLQNIAVCWWRLGNTAEARESLNRAIEYSSNVYTEYIDACLCVDEGKTDDAIQKLAAFKNNHKDLTATDDVDLYITVLERAAPIYLELGLSTEALSLLEEAFPFAKDEQRRRICLDAGICHSIHRSTTDAERFLKEVLRSDSRDSWWVQAQYYLGVCISHRVLG